MAFTAMQCRFLHPNLQEACSLNSLDMVSMSMCSYIQKIAPNIWYNTATQQERTTTTARSEFQVSSHSRARCLMYVPTSNTLIHVYIVSSVSSSLQPAPTMEKENDTSPQGKSWNFITGRERLHFSLEVAKRSRCHTTNLHD